MIFCVLFLAGGTSQIAHQCKFGGMRDLVNFCGDIWVGPANKSGKREFQLRAGAGFCVFTASGCENRKGK